MALTPRDIGKMQFKRSALGRRGYDEGEVDRFLRKVAAELGNQVAANKRMAEQLKFGGQEALVANNEYLATRVAELENRLQHGAPVGNATVDALRGEVDMLQRENRWLREESEKDVTGVTSRAINLLSQAQLSAETTVSEAETYARELVTAAREQYAEILRQAQESAAQAADGMASLTTVPPGAPEPAPAEIEYVRAYAQVAQKQMQTIIDALCTEIDKLGRAAAPPARSESASPWFRSREDAAPTGAAYATAAAATATRATPNPAVPVVRTGTPMPSRAQLARTDELGIQRPAREPNTDN
ncbi:DivIVA domain-containing protein [Nocardia mexicana]|uniref:Cell wall synthesis protein Wag31 n=1 Tax=Nocardia mexicana TaxID=279262 RepID=A0A370GFN7_9NOCA|nr:DivIVA domain-containing protein [Nocardia mexicana]RDI42608.1 DivIVA domain-containing protein [Nocardia mexicana]